MFDYRCCNFGDLEGGENVRAPSGEAAAIAFAASFSNGDRRRVLVSGPGVFCVFEVALEWRAQLVVP